MTVRHVGPFWFEAKWDREGWEATTKKNVHIRHVASIHVARRDGEPNVLTFVAGPLMLYAYFDSRSKISPRAKPLCASEEHTT